jgi:hypothetical protein
MKRQTKWFLTVVEKVWIETQKSRLKNECQDFSDTLCFTHNVQMAYCLYRPCQRPVAYRQHMLGFYQSKIRSMRLLRRYCRQFVRIVDLKLYFQVVVSVVLLKNKFIGNNY